MSVKEMDALQTSSCESDPNQVLTSKECEPTNFRNNSHSARILEDLQSLRKNEVLCDIRLETDDGCATFGHKNVLMAASPFFRAMFESRKMCKTGNNTVHIRKLNSTILQLLVDYIYTGEIIVTKENVQVLLPAANLLQLDFVNGACTEFLKKQLDALNCLGIRAFARLHNCTELLLSSEKLIKKQFLEVVKSDEFPSLSSEDVVKIISCNDLAVPYEEKGVWSSVADMEMCRYRPGVVALDGFLYVIGGESVDESINDTVEIYNPKTNTWTMERFSRSGVNIFGGVVVDRPPNFIN